MFAPPEATNTLNKTHSELIAYFGEFYTGRIDHGINRINGRYTREGVSILFTARPYGEKVQIRLDYTHGPNIVYLTYPRLAPRAVNSMHAKIAAAN